jgi:uncharacterized protein (TIGR03435 family)
MKTKEIYTARASCEAAMLCWCVSVLAMHGAAQTHPATPTEPHFEVVSLKHVGNIKVGEPTFVGSIGHQTFREERPLNYRGVRLSGEVILDGIVRYAYSPLLSPYYYESPDWMGQEVYQVEGIAPVGTTNETARAMLRTALVERLGLQCKLVDREKRICNLLRGSGEPKLAPSTEVDSDKVSHQRGVFKRKSASLAELANFLAFFTGTPVFDKTGITGNYQFDEDWSHATTGRPGDDPNVGFAVAKKLGLKLEAGKQMQKTLVVGRANVEPTPN